MARENHAWAAAGRGLGGRLLSAPGGRASGPTARPREPGAPARCSVRLRVPVTSTEPGSDGGPQTPQPRLAALRGSAQGGRGAAPWCLWERGLPPARLRRAGLAPRSDYAHVTDLNRTESNWVEINGIQRLPTCLPLSLRARPGGEDRPCLRTSQAESALLRQERDRGHHGREGTEGRGIPRTGGDGAGAAEMAMEQVRLAEDADARRHVRADKSISGVAREPHMWNHLEGPPGRQQSQGAGPGICIFKQLLQVDSKFETH